MYIKEPKYFYGNSDYPRLYSWGVTLVEEKGKYRLLEERKEKLYREHGYKPSPEVIITRALQKKFLGVWWTIKSKRFVIDSNAAIRFMCFGEKIEYIGPWERCGMYRINSGT